MSSEIPPITDHDSMMAMLEQTFKSVFAPKGDHWPSFAKKSLLEKQEVLRKNPCDLRWGYSFFTSRYADVFLKTDFSEVDKELDKPLSLLIPNKEEIALQFYSRQPFFYDSAGFFWFWNFVESKYEIKDEFQVMGTLKSLAHEKNFQVTQNSFWTEIIRSLKLVGRGRVPKEMDLTSVQIGGMIYDYSTGNSKKATPEVFATNPIPFEMGLSEETPNIDKLFSQWVSDEFVETLYEIIAYCMTTHKFMQRIFALCGSGSNGKSTYIKLIERFLGEANFVCSELRSLSEDRFEPAVLYRKLLCVMGEVAYDDLKNTNILKKLGGEDKLSFQFKGKTPFTATNTATCICLTNSMPATPDKSIGFYRKWLLIDFPHQFKQIHTNPLLGISDNEMGNLAYKCFKILKRLHTIPEFTHEGDFDERVRRYEERSNPLIRFIALYCDEVPGSMISLRELVNACNAYLVANKLRILNPRQAGLILRNEGFIVGHRKIDDVPVVAVLNLKLKSENTRTTRTTEHQTSFLHIETKSNISSSGSSSISGELDDPLGELIHHKCAFCSDAPCSHWFKGKPVCTVCHEQLIKEGN